MPDRPIEGIQPPPPPDELTSEDEAHSAYMDAANAHYGEYARSA